ncbi:MAG: DUF4290 domain-containing protein [Prevotella sp.]|nr:DUF4290 domain-containing protein [Prevotella sp.]MBQ4296433.1 DUF4290 domain-containing protein [Prevotella sp.]
MNIEGLDYNTQREHLVLPEYGREIQRMVDHAVGLPTREERQRCAETIVAVMERMVPHTGEQDFKRKLWDHLAIMSNFQLDIDWPCDISQAAKIATKPEPMEYPMQDIPTRHYGYMMHELFDKLKTMPEGPERDELARLTANHMKRCLYQWSHGSAADEKVISDIARLTDGVIQLDPDRFTFEKINEREFVEKRKKKK